MYTLHVGCVITHSRDQSLSTTRVGTEDKMVGKRKFLGVQRLGNKKLGTAKGCGRMLNAASQYIILPKNISFVRLFFFEGIMIIQIVLRALGKLNFVLVQGWELNS